MENSQLASLSASIIADNLPNTKFNIADIRAIIGISKNLDANITLVTHIIPSEELCDEDVSQILCSLKDDKFVQLSERHKQPKFNRTPLVERLFLALKAKHFISSISCDDKILKPNYYRPK